MKENHEETGSCRPACVRTSAGWQTSRGKRPAGRGCCGRSRAVMASGFFYGRNGTWHIFQGSINTVNIYDTFSKNSYWWQSNKCTLFTGTRPFVSLSVVICHDSGNGGSLGERLHAGPQSKTLPIGLFMEKVRGL